MGKPIAKRFGSASSIPQDGTIPKCWLLQWDVTRTNCGVAMLDGGRVNRTMAEINSIRSGT